MQRLYTLLIASAMMFPLFAQQEPATTEVDTIKVLDSVEVIEAPDNTKITLGQNEVLIVE